MAAEVDLPGRSEIPDGEFRRFVATDEGGFRIAQFRGQLTHPFIFRETFGRIQQHYAGGIAPERDFGKGIDDV